MDADSAANARLINPKARIKRNKIVCRAAYCFLFYFDEGTLILIKAGRRLLCWTPMTTNMEK